MLFLAFALATAPPPQPKVDQNATCGIGHGKTVVYTRHEIWERCFMPLGGRASPRPGDLDATKIADFMSEHLYIWERLIAPSAREIVRRCDTPPRDGWITQDEFEHTTNRECLGDADSICHTRDVCERETRHLR